MTIEQERAFLEPFFARARAGDVATTAEIRCAFEERIAHRVNGTTIYRLLQRHGWQKVIQGR